MKFIKVVKLNQMLTSVKKHNWNQDKPEILSTLQLEIAMVELNQSAGLSKTPQKFSDTHPVPWAYNTM